MTHELWLYGGLIVLGVSGIGCGSGDAGSSSSASGGHPGTSSSASAGTGGGGGAGGGTSGPMKIASGQNDPGAIAIDAKNIYWLNSLNQSTSTVNKAPLGGGAVTKLAQNSTGQFAALAVDATDVFWTDENNGVFKVPIDGGGATKLAAFNLSAAGVTGIVLDADNVYWATIGQGQPGTVWTVPKSGGAPKQLHAADIDYDIGVLTLQGGNLYWIDYPDEDAGPGQPSHLMSLPTAGGSASVVATFSRDASVDSIASDAENIYWADAPWDGTSGVIWAVQSANGTRKQVVKLEPGIRAETLALDATDIYWPDYTSSNDSDGIRKAPLKGGKASAVAAAAVPWGVAVDAQYVYWSDEGPPADQGSLMKLAK